MDGPVNERDSIPCSLPAVLGFLFLSFFTGHRLLPLRGHSSSPLRPTDVPGSQNAPLHRMPDRNFTAQVLWTDVFGKESVRLEKEREREKEREDRGGRFCYGVGALQDEFDGRTGINDARCKVVPRWRRVVETNVCRDFIRREVPLYVALYAIFQQSSGTKLSRNSFLVLSILLRNREQNVRFHLDRFVGIFMTKTFVF